MGTYKETRAFGPITALYFTPHIKPQNSAKRQCERQRLTPPTEHVTFNRWACSSAKSRHERHGHHWQTKSATTSKMHTRYLTTRASPVCSSKHSKIFKSTSSFITTFSLPLLSMPCNNRAFPAGIGNFGRLKIDTPLYLYFSATMWESYLLEYTYRAAGSVVKKL
jgi:hypothetical protein